MELGRFAEALADFEAVLAPASRLQARSLLGGALHPPLRGLAEGSVASPPGDARRFPRRVPGLAVPAKPERAQRGVPSGGFDGRSPLTNAPRDRRAFPKCFVRLLAAGVSSKAEGTPLGRAERVGRDRGSRTCRLLRGNRTRGIAGSVCALVRRFRRPFPFGLSSLRSAAGSLVRLRAPWRKAADRKPSGRTGWRTQSARVRPRAAHARCVERETHPAADVPVRSARRDRVPRRLEGAGRGPRPRKRTGGGTSSPGSTVPDTGWPMPLARESILRRRGHQRHVSG